MGVYLKVRSSAGRRYCFQFLGLSMAAARRPLAPFHRLVILRPAITMVSKTTKAASVGCYGTGLQNCMLEARGHYSAFAYSPLNFGKYSFMKHMVSQKSWVSQVASSKADVFDSKISIGPQTPIREKDAKDMDVVYYGPISSTIKKVKLLSLSTCCLSVSLGPIITFMTSPDLNVIIKGAVASSVILMSAATTGALHWFVSPYIHKLKWKPGSDNCEVEMMSWMASLIPRTIKFADIKAAETNRPYVSFEAGNSYYFIDAEHCHNKALLQKLTPEKKKKISQSAFKNL